MLLLMTQYLEGPAQEVIMINAELERWAAVQIFRFLSRDLVKDDWVSAPVEHNWGNQLQPVSQTRKSNFAVLY